MTKSRILFNPSTGILRAGWRILWLVLWIAPLFVGMALFSRWLRLHLSSGWRVAGSAATGAVLIFGALWIYRGFARIVEHRTEWPELRVDKDTLRHVGIGFLLGGGVMVVIVSVLTLAGSYHLEAWNGSWMILKALVLYIPQSFSEDFVFGLILYRLMKEGLGRRAALLIAPLLFGLAHVGNDHESWVGILEIFTGGCLMYYLFDRTGSFFAVWALHFSWNFTMNGIFGLANSGQSITGLIRSRVSGPIWLTGGATGPEASLLAVGFDVLLLLVLWRTSERVLWARRA